jgi:hypothetical protein
MLVFYFTLPDDASDNELSRRVFSGDDMAFLCTLKIAFVNVLSDRVPGAVADTQGTCRSSRSVSRLRSSNSVVRLISGRIVVSCLIFYDLRYDRRGSLLLSL